MRLWQQFMSVDFHLALCTSLCVIMFVVAPLSYAFANTSDSGSVLDNLIKFWHYINPPKNYFKPLVDCELDISQQGIVKKFKFTHRYKGNYNAGIFLSNFDFDVFFAESKYRYKPKLQMEIKFYANNSVIMSKTTGNGYSPILCEHGGGLIFVHYKTPNDLPVDQEIECEVKIITPDKELQDSYGPARFYIRKGSDE